MNNIHLTLAVGKKSFYHCYINNKMLLLLFTTNKQTKKTNQAYIPYGIIICVACEKLMRITIIKV